MTERVKIRLVKVRIGEAERVDWYRRINRRLRGESEPVTVDTSSTWRDPHSTAGGNDAGGRDD